MNKTLTANQIATLKALYAADEPIDSTRDHDGINGHSLNALRRRRLVVLHDTRNANGGLSFWSLSDKGRGLVNGGGL